jgi:Protein of unknown function (DUF3237)
MSPSAARRQQRLSVFAALFALPASLLGCGDAATSVGNVDAGGAAFSPAAGSPPSSGSGGALGSGGDAPSTSSGGTQSAAGAAAAGSPSGGTTSAGAHTGGTASAGSAGSADSNSSGSANGGSANGGSANGGSANSGGANSGGANSGGANSGGTNSGGTNSGGTNSGGTNSNGRTLVPDPSWTCGKPEGIVDPTLGRLVFRSTLSVGEVRDVGATPFGQRRVIDLTGGSIASERLEASVLTGGIDLELKLSSGATELEQVMMLRAKDNSYVYLRTCGVAPPGDSAVRIVADFEAATSSSVAWLNTGTFIGTRSLDAAAKKLELAVYDVSAVGSESAKLKLEDPPGVPHQSWECAKASGTRGAEVFTETVTLGGSQSVGASKRGTRNVIPITGGTVSGKLTGTVLPAGADYQLLGGSTTLDARYVLASNAGELVIVRNCGPFGALIPTFEARAAGPLAFLNTGKFISSDPGSAPGGVRITFYELK